MKKQGRRLGGSAGFSLIEVMIGIAILAGLVEILYMTLFTSQNVYIAGNRLADLQNQARIVLDEMAKDLRQSSLSRVFVAAINGSNYVTFQQDTGYAGGTIAWGQSILWQVGANSAVWRIAGTNLPMVQPSGPGAISKSPNVATGGLVIVPTGNKLSISLTLNGMDDQRHPLSATTQTSVTLRN